MRLTRKRQGKVNWSLNVGSSNRPPLMPLLPGTLAGPTYGWTGYARWRYAYRAYGVSIPCPVALHLQGQPLFRRSSYVGRVRRSRHPAFYPRHPTLPPGKTPYTTAFCFTSCHGLTRIPSSIISQASTITTIMITNSDQPGKVVRITPVASGFNAAPSQPNACAEK